MMLKDKLNHLVEKEKEVTNLMLSATHVIDEVTMLEIAERERDLETDQEIEEIDMEEMIEEVDQEIDMTEEGIDQEVIPDLIETSEEEDEMIGTDMIEIEMTEETVDTIEEIAEEIEMIEETEIEIEDLIETEALALEIDLVQIQETIEEDHMIEMNRKDQLEVKVDLETVKFKEMMKTIMVIQLTMINSLKDQDLMLLKDQIKIITRRNLVILNLLKKKVCNRILINKIKMKLMKMMVITNRMNECVLSLF